MITIYSSDNKFKISDEGEILKSDYESEIVKFDTKEFKKYYGYLNKNIDILDIGFWINSGLYSPADEFFRNEVKTGS